MANRSITQLQVSNYPLTGNEVIPLVQDGITKQALAAWFNGTAITNDVTTAADLFPLFADVSSGVSPFVHTSDPQYTFNPASGTLTSPVINASHGIVLNDITINQSYTIPVGSNGMSSGPIIVASGATVTVSTGSSWNIVGASTLAPWTISSTPTKLLVKYNGSPVTSIDTVGDIATSGSVTAFGTP